MDASGNIYVTGRSHQAATASDDFVVIKYNSAGAQQWATTYDYLNRDDVPVGLSVDAGGNVYIAGSSCSDPADCKLATIKLNAAGVEQWHVVYDNGGASAVSTPALK